MVNDEESRGMTTARYEKCADWYVSWTRRLGSGRGPSGSGPGAAFGLFPDDLSGQRVLDLACGYGSASRNLARRGAKVVGLDVSAKLLEHARADETAEPLGIHYIDGDATQLRWWDGQPFNGVLCSMALMDIDDLDGVLRTVAQVLAPRGWFVFSIFHPCYPGGPIGSADGLPSWPPEHGYATEGWWTTNGEGARGHVGANHRMLSTYLNAVLRTGLVFEEFAEPPYPVPRFLIARCRRGIGPTARQRQQRQWRAGGGPFRWLSWWLRRQATDPLRHGKLLRGVIA